MAKEEFQMPKEGIGNKKEKMQEKSAKAEMPDFVKRLKEEEKPKNWLKEKYDKWREQM